jgi:polysaccharide biosynthesis protein PslH
MIYFISESNDIKTGGGIATYSNYVMLKKYYDNHEIIQIPLSNSGKSIIKRFFNFVFNFSNINVLVNFEKKSIIWVDRSIFGFLILFLKVTNPRSKIKVFYHNNEYEYFKDLYKLNPNIINKVKVYSIVLNEFFTYCFANEFYFINPIQKNKFKRSNTFLNLPKFTFIENRFNSYNSIFNYFLIVGSNFPPNIEGINWFINNVAIFTSDVNYVIIGKDLNISLDETKLPSNVKLHSNVKSTESFFKNCVATICPIKFGSGLKIKIAEAIFFGKKTITFEKNASPFREILKEDFNKFIISVSSKDELINSIKSFKLESTISNKYFE